MQETINVNVLVDDDHMKDLDRVIAGLTDGGFTLTEALNDVGVLIGTAPSDAISALKNVSGVVTVSPDRTDYRPTVTV